MNTYWLYFILLDPFSLAIQGGSIALAHEQNSIIIDWSLGQPAAGELFNKDYSIFISNGFLQNKNCDRCLYKNIDSFLVQLKIGPNPIVQYLYMQLNQAGIFWQGVDIYNLEGKLIQRTKVNQSAFQLRYNINFNGYPKGIYFLKCYFLIDQQFPIIKTIQIYKT